MTMDGFQQTMAESGCKMAGEMMGAVALSMWLARSTATDPDELEASMIKIVEHVQQLSSQMPIPEGGMNLFGTEVFVAIAQACDLVAIEFRTMIAGEARQ